MALFQSPGRVPLFIVRPVSRAMYGIMAPPPILRISPETRSDPTDLLFLIAPILFLIVLISILSGSPVFSPCIVGISLSLLNAVE